MKGLLMMQAEHVDNNVMKKADSPVCDQHAEMIGRLAAQLSEDEKIINSLIAQTNKLQAQVNYLKNENKGYREKLDKIRSVWYGRLGICVYKKSKQIKNRIMTVLKG